jgi:SAM-dependent methyltransferase
MKIERWIAANEQAIDTDWLFDEWVALDSTHNAWREEQMRVLGTIIETVDAADPVVVDLGCGAGCLSEFLLKTQPRLRIIAVDPNPFLLMIYRGHLSEYADRFTVVTADMRKEEVLRTAGPFNAAVSLTSFHHLSRQSILNIYRRLHRLLPRGGVFANGDVATLSDPWFEGVCGSLRHHPSPIRIDAFWSSVKDRFGIGEEIDELKTLTAPEDTPEHGYPQSFYVNSLRWAGFAAADVVFQAGNRIVYCGRKA